MGSDGGIAGAVSHLDCVERLGERTNLVDLDEDRVGSAELDSLLEVLNVGDEEIVADELALRTDGLGESHPAVPVSFSHTIFDRVDRILLDETLEVLDLLCARTDSTLLAFLPGVVVLAVLVELGSSAVHSNRDILTRLVTSLLDGRDDAIESVFDRVECRGEATFVTDCGREVASLENLLEAVEHLSTATETFLEALSADGADHELLESDRRIRVGAAVDDVHHRNGEGVGVGAADVAVKGKTEGSCCCLSDCERDAEDGVSAELRLGRRAVELEHELVDAALIASAKADELRCDDLVNIGHSLGDALAEIALGVAVAQFKSFVDAGGRPGRDGRATKSAVLEDDVDFNRGVSARIDNFPRDDFLNCSVHFIPFFMGKAAIF